MLDQHKKRIIYITIGIVILLILYALKNTSYFLRAFTFIFSILLFYLADYFFNFDFKTHHYLTFILIAGAGILLSPFYFLYPNYDKILHILSPILLSILIFYLINKTKLKFSTKLMITFAFMITFLALFEIGEYLLDVFFDLKLQGVFSRSQAGLTKLNIVMNKNDDTMIDLILGTIGALTFTAIKSSIFCYKKSYMKKSIKNKAGKKKI